MYSFLDAFLRSWPFDPWQYLALGATAAIYLRGYAMLRRRPLAQFPSPLAGEGLGVRGWRSAGVYPSAPPLSPKGRGERSLHWPSWPVAAFLCGLFAILLALASPIEPFSSLLLQVHMVQHLLLMMVAPPLLWLGRPMLPLVRGLPEPVRTYWIVPLFQSAMVRRFFARCTHPATALPLYVAATWIWHLPRVYDLALRSAGWHYLQHACFLIAALAFWYPVVRPYPSRPPWSQWLLLPYLLLADVQNTILAALLTFSDRVLYPYYLEVPRLGGLSALEDQAAAGVLMWVPGSAAFLVPLFVIGVRLLSGDKALSSSVAQDRVPLPLVGGTGATGGLSSSDDAGRSHGRTSRPWHPQSSQLDLLRLQLLGGFLRWRHARLALQLPLLALAVIVIWDGLAGPQVAPMNLAGVIPWIHWRGIIVIGLLAAGNVFCLGCPFLLPRTLARRWLPRGRAWPMRLRNKWPAIVLVALFLWAYEAFALWNSPWWTAWIALGYFVAAFVVDGVYRDAAFCKYLCPIGQFNFVQSLVSPLEVAVREPAVCTSCKTKDCIRGRDGIPGCELHLFQPRKSGNMDCTMCLDCLHACPHDNIGVLAGLPGRDLWREPPRSGVGSFATRPDLAALVVVLVFGAFANAAGMVAPVLAWQDRLRAALGWQSALPLVTAYYFMALVVLPLAAVSAAAALSRRWAMSQAGLRFVYALVPLGFSMWLAHYSFHFLTSYDAAIPAVQRFANDVGYRFLGEPGFVAACCRPVAEWLPRLEILCLDCGLLLSLYAGYRIALAQPVGVPNALKALAPWAVLIVLLFAAGVWIVLQPMEMRGLTMAG